MTSLSQQASDPGNILLLLQELADLPCNDVQQKLNKYFQIVTGAKVVFLAPILIESEEMVIHVVGEKILERELRFPVSQSNVICNVIGVKSRFAQSSEASEIYDSKCHGS